MKVKQTVEQDVFEPGWAETSDRFPLDTLLRKYGFKIHARVRGAGVQWIKDGALYTQEEALRECPSREVALARGDQVVEVCRRGNR